MGRNSSFCSYRRSAFSFIISWLELRYTQQQQKQKTFKQKNDTICLKIVSYCQGLFLSKINLKGISQIEKHILFC